MFNVIIERKLSKVLHNLQFIRMNTFYFSVLKWKNSRLENRVNVRNLQNESYSEVLHYTTGNNG